jgi:hypothetical protein
MWYITFLVFNKSVIVVEIVQFMHSFVSGKYSVSVKHFESQDTESMLPS